MLHTWGSALTHHPHAHIIVPGGGFSPDGSAGLPADPDSFFRAGALTPLPPLVPGKASGGVPAPGSCSSSVTRPRSRTPRRSRTVSLRLRRAEWVVYAKRPFGGPAAVLAYLSRYTHRVAIANSRLIAFNHSRRYLQMEGLPRQ